MKEKHKCCICNCDFEGYGNNPWPLVTDEGARCCDECNHYVILERIRQITERDDKKGEDKNESITRE